MLKSNCYFEDTTAAGQQVLCCLVMILMQASTLWSRHQLRQRDIIREEVEVVSSELEDYR
jgi:hypothetical protein